MTSTQTARSVKRESARASAGRSPVEGLRASTHLKAAGRTFAWIVVGPWVAFGGAFLLAVPRRAEEAALVFLVWVLAGLLYDLSLVRHSQAWLRAGLRRRVSEGTGAVAGTPPSTAAARGAR